MIARFVSRWAIAALIAGGLAATAHGQGADLDSRLDAGETTGLDTANTPRAKSESGWTMVAGARFGSSRVTAGSATSFDTDLHAVSFRNRKRGLAGGTRCREAPEDPKEVTSCERVPAIYEYEQPDTGERIWKRASLPGDDRGGYVGAIAWISDTRALAVGGDGIYPRREHARGDGESYESWVARDRTENAGTARAWLYEKGAWSEVDLSELMQGPVEDRPRGMTAVDFEPGANPERGFAGALGQVWEWSDGGFVKRIDRNSPHAEIHERKLFSYRVRQIRWHSVDGPCCPRLPIWRATAITAGYGSEGRATNLSRLLIYNDAGASGAYEGRWRVTRLGTDNTEPADPERRREQFDDVNVKAEDCGLVMTGSQTPNESELACVNTRYATVFTGAEIEAVASRPNGTHWRVSMGCLPPRETGGIGTLTPGICDLAPAPLVEGSAKDGTTVATQWSHGDTHCTGGPYPLGPPARDFVNGRLQQFVGPDAIPSLGETPLEPVCAPLPEEEHTTPGSPVSDAGLVPPIPEAIYGPGYQARSTNEDQLAPESLYSFTGFVGSGGNFLGLLSPGGPVEDGELSSAFTNDSHAAKVKLSTTRLVSMDANWSVGQLRGRRSELGSMGLLYDANRPRGQAVTTPVVTEPDPGYKPTSGEQLLNYIAGNYYSSSTYALNAIDEINQTAWAVGDRGAILMLGSDAFSESTPEPKPPELGTRQPASLPDTSAYDSARPGKVAEPGLVPPRSPRPPAKLPSPRVTAAGDLPALTQIVMSHSGDEGWGVGSGRLAAYFDGLRWHPCPADGKAAPAPQPMIHPHCLAAYRGGHPQISKAFRVPLEKDSDPSNDGDFEIATIRSSGKEVNRHRTGGAGWRRDTIVQGPVWTDQFRVRDLAFVTPDDAWLLIDPCGSTEKCGPGSGLSGVPASPNHNPPQAIAHYSDGAWRDCAATCDPTKRMPRMRWQGAVEGLEVAGDRIYGRGYWWGDGQPPTGTSNDSAIHRVPFVIFRDPSTKAWNPAPVSGEYDPHYWPHRPGVPNDMPKPGTEAWREHVGEIETLRVERRPDGSYEGWAVGVFGRPIFGRVPSVHYDVLVSAIATNEARRVLGGKAAFMRTGSGGWRKDSQPIFEDHYKPFQEGPSFMNSETSKTQGVVRDGAMAIDPETGRALIGGSGGAFGGGGGHLFSFNGARARWELEPSDRPHGSWASSLPSGDVNAAAPDGDGGFWISIGSRMYRHTDRPEPPVFDEVAMPAGEHGRPIRALAGTADGRLWAGTNSDFVYRYDRLLGWNRVRIPGWNPGRVVVAPSPINALALNDDGDGVGVGPGGRIARIERDSIRLDAAAGKVCDLAAPVPPCGTTLDLHAAAVAPDGSAIAGGDRLTLLWRPAGGEFRRIATPDAAEVNSVRSLAMPTPDRAWLGTSEGLIFAGTMSADGEWKWRWENPGDRAGFAGQIVIGPDGRGYALAGGNVRSTSRTVFERDPGREGSRWRGTGFSATSIAIAAGGGKGVIAGTATGVSTLIGGRFEPSRVGRGEDLAIGSVALLPGHREGDVEAWATTGTRLFHHSSESGGDRLLDPAGRVRPLPDSPPRRPGELAVAAFGKTSCLSTGRCYEMSGSSEYSEVLSQRIVDALERRRPQAAVFTGDSVDNPGYAGEAVAESVAGPGTASWAVEPGHNFAGNAAVGTSGSSPPGVSAHARKKLARWGELVTDRLTDRGVPVLGAIGGRDLTAAALCQNAARCLDVKEAKTGENLGWRKAMGGRSKPWGEGRTEMERDGLRFSRVSGGELKVETEDTEMNSAAGVESGASKTIPTGGAPTHYAVDVTDPARGGQPKVARLVFLDNSYGSLAASDPVQRPTEVNGGQAAWLDRMLCEAGTPAPGLGRCTRRPGQLAIVVANTPTYSYAPAKPNDIATDSAALEATLLRHGASLFVAGRIGWNGLYWTRAPALHEPCPGGSYPEQPPGEGLTTCGEPPPGEASLEQAAGDVGDALSTAGAPRAPAVDQDADSAAGLRGALPSIVASGAGGELLVPNGAAKDGYWHGYTIARLDPSGDPRRTVVEQRPIYDVVGLEAAARSLKPGQKMRLRGFGRGPVASQEFSILGSNPFRIDRIDGPAVTHAYALFEADPERPWLPRQSADGSYAALDPSVATVDSQTGQIKVGRGNHPRVFAVATLSVGCVPASDAQQTCAPDPVAGIHAATYPLTFESRRSFSPPAARAAPQAPRVIVQSAAAATPGTPPSATPPQVAGLTPPVLPNLTPPPPPAAGPPAASPQPPPPPPPPPPPSIPAAVDLTLAPPGLTIAPPSAVIPPPAPPINPAPPGGARKEARQRQAATEKSGSGAGTGDSKHEVDTAQDHPGAPGAQMTRRDRTKASPSFTTVRREEQASAWARGALYGGGLTLAALALAGGWGGARPRPKSRQPAVPAPARADAYRQRQV